MKQKRILIGFLALIPIIAFTGCGFFINEAEITDTMIAEIEELQGLLPAFDAALTLVEPSEPGARTISTTTEFDGADPIASMPAAFYTSLGGGETDPVRYPAAEDTYMTGFYGTAGNEAVLELSKYSDSPELYKVSLKIYPVLSASVYYVHEEYYVGPDSWNIVDDQGSSDPLAYITNKTYYFDGRVADHTVVWNRYADTDPQYYYDTLFDETSHDDPDTTLFDYPTTSDPEQLSDLEPLHLLAAADDGKYSSYVVSSIGDTGEEVVEFYTEVDGAKSAVSYSTRSDSQGSWYSSTEKTVRRYMEDADGNKTVRAKTVTTMTFSGYTWEVVTSEEVDIAVTLSGVAYSSTTVSDQLDTTNTTAVSLTGDGTGQFTGTLTYTVGDISTSYDVAMNSASGLEIEDEEGNTSQFDAGDRTINRKVLVELSKGGSFDGVLKGKELRGNYTAGKKSAEVLAALGFISIDTGKEKKVK